MQEKLSASALRKRLLIRMADNSGGRVYDAFLKTGEGLYDRRRVGRISVSSTGRVSWAEIKKELRGMGLGKKFYSEVLKDQSKLRPDIKYPMYGDSFQSGYANSAWKSLGNSKKLNRKKIKGEKKTLTEERFSGISSTSNKEKELPISIYRPGSEKDVAQAERMIKLGRPEKEWALDARIKRWKKSPSRQMPDKKDRKKAKKKLFERGGFSARFKGSEQRRGGAGPVEVKRLEDARRGKAAVLKAERGGGMMSTLTYDYDPSRARTVGKEIQKLRERSPGDVPISFGSLMSLKTIRVNKKTREAISSGQVELADRLSDRTIKNLANNKNLRFERRDVNNNFLVYTPKYQARIINKKMLADGPRLTPSIDYSKKQRPHGKKKVEGPALDYTK